jgi:hypothetical protein
MRYHLYREKKGFLVCFRTFFLFFVDLVVFFHSAFLVGVTPIVRVREHILHLLKRHHRSFIECLFLQLTHTLGRSNKRNIHLGLLLGFRNSKPTTKCNWLLDQGTRCLLCHGCGKNLLHLSILQEFLLRILLQALLLRFRFHRAKKTENVLRRLQNNLRVTSDTILVLQRMLPAPPPSLLPLITF